MISFSRTTGIALLIGLSAALGIDATSAASLEINTKDIVRHVVPRDAIASLSEPKYDQAADAGYMRDDDRVIAIDYAGEQLAYPTRILEHHEIVNEIGSSPNFLLHG